MMAPHATNGLDPERLRLKEQALARMTSTASSPGRYRPDDDLLALAGDLGLPPLANASLRNGRVAVAVRR